ncbi:uncharacterized protein LOC132725440 [Ruditapes philippinarum]|uniref:uncharacterized protein LOC132725440 n=1 Tax=Ruditapes philippinarum TaxID=129788 RepID=UPI00295AD22F|nr:uncharacterized protein LOC132725440 [Ruditapes philippinarum]
MMLSGLFLVCFVTGSTYGQFTPISPDSFKVFLSIFRQTLLEQVAVEVNKTIEASNELTPLVDACKLKIESQVNLCKSCALSKCKKSPTFIDLLNLANPHTHLKGTLDKIGKKVDVAVELIGDKVGGFINYFKDIGTAFKSYKLPKEEFEFLFKQIQIGIQKAVDSLKNLGKDISSFTIDTKSLIGDKLKDLKDIFGKRRRKREVIDPKVKQCMQQCASCRPLLLPTENEVLTAVCGSAIVAKNNTLQNQLKKIQDVYAHTLDKVNPIVKSVEADFSSMQGLKVTKVQITVFKNGAYTSYLTGVPVYITDLAVSPAKPMALEYWLKF